MKSWGICRSFRRRRNDGKYNATDSTRHTCRGAGTFAEYAREIDGCMLSEASAFHYVATAEGSGIFHADHFEECGVFMAKHAYSIWLPAEFDFSADWKPLAFYVFPDVFARLDWRFG